MRKYFYILILISSISCSDYKNSNQVGEKKIDTLIYSIDGFNSGVELALLSDNRFLLTSSLFGCTGGGEIKTYKGIYVEDSTSLNLQPDSVRIKTYPIDEFFESKNTIIQILPYKKDSLEINTRFQKLNWSENKYLLSDDLNSFYGYRKNETDYEDFAYYFNSGLEPDSHGSYLVSKDSTKNEKINSFSFSKIPEKYRSKFLQNPIEAVIIKSQLIEETDSEIEHWIVTLNKGKADGVIKNLIFQSKDGYLTIDPIKILQDRTIGKIYAYENDEGKDLNGILFKTKWNK